MATIKKIRMNTNSAGPDGNLIAGKEYSVPGEVTLKEARELIKGRYAVEVKPQAKTKRVTEPEAGDDEETEDKK